MKVSLNWLKKHVKTSLSPNKIADGLTDLGLECTYEKTGISFTDIIVANVVECNPLKDSDHLSVCIVDVGNQERYTVVCGAPNIKSGVYVPFAKIGATLDYGQFKIKRTKIRSFLKVCSASPVPSPSAEITTCVPWPVLESVGNGSSPKFV